jgi:hypothetical protein
MNRTLGFRTSGPWVKGMQPNPSLVQRRRRLRILHGRASGPRSQGPVANPGDTWRAGDNRWSSGLGELGPEGVWTLSAGLKNYFAETESSQNSSDSVAHGLDGGSRLSPEPIWLSGTSLCSSRLRWWLVRTMDLEADSELLAIQRLHGHVVLGDSKWGVRDWPRPWVRSRVRWPSVGVTASGALGLYK